MATAANHEQMVDSATEIETNKGKVVQTEVGTLSFAYNNKPCI